MGALPIYHFVKQSNCWHSKHRPIDMTICRSENQNRDLNTQIIDRYFLRGLQTSSTKKHWQLFGRQKNPSRPFFRPQISLEPLSDLLNFLAESSLKFLQLLLTIILMLEGSDSVDVCFHVLEVFMGLAGKCPWSIYYIYMYIFCWGDNCFYVNLNRKGWEKRGFVEEWTLQWSRMICRYRTKFVTLCQLNGCCCVIISFSSAIHKPNGINHCIYMICKYHIAVVPVTTWLGPIYSNLAHFPLWNTLHWHKAASQQVIGQEMKRE